MVPELPALLARTTYGNQHKNILRVAYVEIEPHTRGGDERGEYNSRKFSTIACISGRLSGFCQHALQIATIEELSIVSGRSCSGNTGRT